MTAILKKFSPPMRQFIVWAVVITVAIFSISAWLAHNLVAERSQNIIAEVDARTALQAQGRAASVGEWLQGTLTLGEHITQSDLVRLFSTDAAKIKTEADAKKSAILMQKPYLDHTLRELKEKYALTQALLIGQKGTLLAHSYTEPQPISLTETQYIGQGIVLSSQEPMVLPFRVENGQLILDIIKPVLNMEEDLKAKAVATLLISLPVSDKVKMLLASGKLDKEGERMTLLQRQGDKDIAAIMPEKIIALNTSEATLIKTMQKPAQSIKSPVDNTKVFARLMPVYNTPFFVLQEFNTKHALGVILLYKNALYGMLSLAAIALIALMLTLIGYLLAQRNRTRVRLLGQTMDALVRAVELRDPYLSGHHMRTARLALRLGNALGYSVDERATLFYAAQLSGVGKMFVSQEILTKKTKLTAPERKKLEAHVSHATKVLGDIGFDLPIVPTIEHMYEREDGSGYPNRLKSAKISMLSKVLAVCDAYSAMIKPRAYRKALTSTQAVKELEKGSKYDIAVIQTLKEIL